VNHPTLTQAGHLDKSGKVKAHAHRAGLPGKVISFCIVPLHPAYPARAGRGTFRSSSVRHPKPFPELNSEPILKQVQHKVQNDTLGRRPFMDLKIERLDFPEGCNIIFGQTHFIKTVEDLYEIIIGAVPNAKFGIGFCEASGACLVRGEGNDEGLKELAMKNALRIGAGHTFNIILKDAFPINILNAVKMCQEVCNIFCATANPLEVILAQSEQGRGVLGVIDGSFPKGMEKEDGVAWRKELLRKFKYKL